MRRRISGKEAIYMAIENAKLDSVKVQPLPESDAGLPTKTAKSSIRGASHRKPPPRVRKPEKKSRQFFLPTSHTDAHRAELRKAFGNTCSDEFAEAMLGQLVTGLQPGSYDELDEAKLNAAIAIVASVKPQTEMIAFLAVQSVIAGFAGMKFLRESQYQMDETHVEVYGGFAIKCFRVETGLIRDLDRHQRGNKQTIEVQHVHIHSGGQGVVGIVNAAETREGSSDE
jgi:hypothetical protein